MKTRTAKENIAALPPECFVNVPGNGKGKRIGVVKAGATGYFHRDGISDRPEWTDKEVDATVAELNAAKGVTPAQAGAMQYGSMFGWDTPAANVENFSEAGELL